MQEIILENLAKWFSNLDFSLNKQDDKFSLTCKELNIKVENLPRDEFILVVTEQGITGIEKLFNLKALGIDLKELFSLKTEKSEKPEKQEINEDWIKEELEKAFRNGKLNKSKPIIDDYFRDYTQNFKDFPKFPWNQVICLVE